jgi:predicted RNA-binding Zn-ribbon protein involved in translation (DUF1610 family)
MIMAAIAKCPGQDTKVWSAQSLSEVACPNCGNEIEFWKDDRSRKCEKCGEEVMNPTPPPVAQQAQEGS